MTGPMTIAELDDESGKVYVFGVDAPELREEEFELIIDALDSVFVEAETFVVNVPVDGDMDIHEISEDDLQEIVDYYDVMEPHDG